ncbi:Predicted ester cyclase [Paraburkholderia fungorum]|uniref:Predicted ester cyclase n=1 Tax=Paraburkholderia fungorum TaxID=134537 RepID=A0A1H1AIU6_9BURK|nr:ester cyclase [Paraburkholderia fungorum]SDQ39461.1 Predicted ester cyclase [Paraburkholderia fungorum]
MSTAQLSRIARHALLAVGLAGALAASSAHAASATDDTALPVPHHVAFDTTSAQSEAVVQTARRYAAFWNTGDEAWAKLALSPEFVDRTLPDGRPQGPQGPLTASKGFRAAVPDLHAEIDDLVVAGDRASVHLHFYGHFTGQFQNLQGSGQKVDFQAFDLYRVKDGRIVENWHLEDNLTLLKQLGAIKP